VAVARVLGMIVSNPDGWILLVTARLPAFVGGVGDPVERFGGVLPGGQHADVVDLCGCPHRSIYAGPATMPRVCVARL
jgi:hypothetical protein